MSKLKVEQFHVKNQFVIYTDEGQMFQSYDTIIALIDTQGRVFLDKNWDYSKTTGKYRNKFLGEDKASTERKIKTGEYTIRDLN
jgi:hypothetical protein